jgi:hypothetical protein
VNTGLGLTVIGNGNNGTIYVTDAGGGGGASASSIKIISFNLIAGNTSASDDSYVSFVVYGSGYSFLLLRHRIISHDIS